MVILENVIAKIDSLKEEFNLIKECLWRGFHFTKYWKFKAETKQWRFLFW